jgi:cysteine dioxygenase
MSTLTSSMQHLIHQITQHESINVNILAELVSKANLKPDDLMPWSDFDHPESDSYGRQMVHDGGFFEVMVMSWKPEDFSAIHDHGYTQWGVVQVFGEAEHAVFECQNDRIRTAIRETLHAGDIRTVSHELIHQMGNPSSTKQFLSLHIYGNIECKGNITGDAQIFELDEKQVQRVDGGVFFALHESEIKSREGTLKPDHITWLRHTIELLKRLRRHPDSQQPAFQQRQQKLQQALFDPENWFKLRQQVEYCLNSDGFIQDTARWNIINWELKQAAKLEQQLIDNHNGEDAFDTYAHNYDAIIGTPSLDLFMRDYLDFFFDQCETKPRSILSIGCGTGLMEVYLQQTYQPEKLLGMDVSPAMVEVAKKRIDAEVADIANYQTDQQWDMVYTGLNVLQYLAPEDLPSAVGNISNAVKPGGYFVGDFITPDHIRRYPNFIQSSDETVLSLRTPVLIESGHKLYKRSEIINISINDGQLRINYEGGHKRYLPTIAKVIGLFKEYGFAVTAYDALSLEKLEDDAETSPSTRYLLIARKS